MIGIIVGVVSSIIIFSFYTKDQRAVKEFKQKKINQQKEKQQLKRKQKEQIERIKNDPAIKKKKEDQQEMFKNKFMNNVDPEDKKLIQEYLEKYRKEGKTDQQILKEASNSATLFMGLAFLVCALLIVGVLILYGVELEQVKSAVFKFLGMFFPKIKNTETTVPSEEL